MSFVRLFFVLLVLFTVGVVGCSYNRYSFEYYDNKEIKEIEYTTDDSETRTYLAIVEGNMRVFIYERDTRPDKICDVGESEIIMFQVSPLFREFNLEGESLLQAKCYWTLNRAWSAGSLIHVVDGIIRGEEIGCIGRYRVSIDINIHDEFERKTFKRKFNGVFIPKSPSLF